MPHTHSYPDITHACLAQTTITPSHTQHEDLAVRVHGENSGGTCARVCVQATQGSCALEGRHRKTPHSTRSAPPRMDDQVTGTGRQVCQVDTLVRKVALSHHLDSPPLQNFHLTLRVAVQLGGAQYAFDSCIYESRVGISCGTRPHLTTGNGLHRSTGQVIHRSEL